MGQGTMVLAEELDGIVAWVMSESMAVE